MDCSKIKVSVRNSPLRVQSRGLPGPQGHPGETGPQGAKGDIGPQGAVGPQGAPNLGYNFTQSSASTSWSIAHNLGYRPSVSVFGVGGVEIVGDVQHLSDNVLQISFATPVSGTARLS